MATRTYPHDSADFLASHEDISAYLNGALATGDAAFIAQALGTVARARGMTQVARDAGLSRESLYRALSREGNPELTTLLRVVKALGLRLDVSIAQEHAPGT